MKDYKLAVKTFIPKENLKQWIEQAKEIKKVFIDEAAGLKQE
ncbi:MAG TPA: hypothetical protein VLG50_06100 [Candidatus Saccharimonadales bacterium]|nr:hypothetical protein [Candidatus Saccharimonadales bacterium]